MDFIPRGVFGVSTPWQSNAQGSIRLIAPYATAPQDNTVTFGVEFKPAPGWIVYWKNAGDAGFSPKFNFKESTGFANAKVLWPRPKFFMLPGDIKEYGYNEDVVYPIQAQRTKTASVHIMADVNYLTCREICVPHRYALTLDLPATTVSSPDPAMAALLQTFIQQVPPDTENVLASLHPEKIETPNAAPASPTLWAIILLGFVGGLILNVMPCVLPVLSIKLFGLLQHAGESRAVIIRDALASAAGIVFSFLGGATLAIIAQKAGHAVGWGIQFQNPGFIVFLIVVVLLFALNLWGVFEINLPSALTRVGAIGQDDEGALSYFVSGMFATLLATPCSAPFLGTAMGFALSQPAGMTLAIFAAAGTGMAFPYLVLAVFPTALHWLPRPGVWMVRLKSVLGFFLLATAFWLGWVFVQQVGWVQRTTLQSGPIEWVRFQEDQIPGLAASGKTVFVDVTAEWCLTCKVNERLVLSDDEVMNEFKQRGVVMMRADWTHQDAVIGDYLKRYGRVGIPFYALYVPGHDPVLLSEFLTKKQVLNALQGTDTLH